MLSVAFAEHTRLSDQLELLPGVLTDGLEHPEAILRAADEALLDQRLQHVQVGVTDLFRSLERAATGEYGQAGGQLLLFRGGQVVAPLDRRAEGALARVGVPAAPEQVESLREPLEDLLDSEDAGAGGGELER